MNMIDIQDKLKNLSEDQLIKEMQMPSGQAPQFLVLSEITRRKKMRDSMKAADAKQGIPSVAEEAVAAAAVPQQGLPQMASAMAPKSSIAQNTGIASLPVQRMASGGLVQKMAEGGRIVVRNGQRFIEREDGSLVPETRTMSMMDNLRQLPTEIAAIPGQLGSAARDFSAGFANVMNADLSRAGDDAMRRQMAEDAYGMRAGPDTSYQYPPVPTIDTTPMDQVAMALEGRSGFPTVDLDLTQLAADRTAAMDAGQAATMLGVSTPLGMPPEVGAGRSGFPTMTSVTPAAATPFPMPPVDVAPGPSFEDRGRSPQPSPELAQGYGDAMMVPNWREGMPSPEDMPNYEIPQVLKDAYSMVEGAINPLAKVRDFATGLIPGGEASPRADRDQQGDVEEDGGLPPDAVPDATETQSEAPILTLSSTEGGGGTGGGQGGSGGASGQGGFVSELESALSRAERTKEQDKWLALAQAGLALMASDQPTLGGAIGEAGQVGIEAFRGARDTYEQSRMSILEAIASQRAAAVRAAGGGGRGGSGSGAGDIGKILSAINSDLEWMTTEVTGYDDSGNEVTKRVPIQGYEDTVANLNAMRDQLARERYGLNSIDARQ